MESVELIFGGATIGIGNFSEVDAVEQLLLRLKELGIKRIDTAARYAGGLSETMLGEAGAANKHGFTIDTKIMFTPPGNGTLTEKAISKSIETSLGRLQVEKVNVLTIHAPDPETSLTETASALDKHHKAGHFEHLGLSNYTVAQVEEWHRICDTHGYVRPSFYQGQYNILARECEKATVAEHMAGVGRNCEPNMLPVIRKLGMSFNAHSPLAWGVLTGKLFAGDESLKGSRLANDNPQGGLARVQYDKPYIREALKEFEAVCLQEKVSLMESSLRWLVLNSALGTGDGVILGASRVEQVVGNVELIQKKHLPDAVVKAVDVLWDSIITQGL